MLKKSHIDINEQAVQQPRKTQKVKSHSYAVIGYQSSSSSVAILSLAEMRCRRILITNIHKKVLRTDYCERLVRQLRVSYGLLTWVYQSTTNTNKLWKRTKFNWSVISIKNTKRWGKISYWTSSINCSKLEAQKVRSFFV